MTLLTEDNLEKTEARNPENSRDTSIKDHDDKATEECLSFEKKIKPIINKYLSSFDSVVKAFMFFNSFFFVASVIELFLFFVFFSFLIKSSLIAFSLSLIFLTVFSYFTLRLYFKVQQPERLHQIRESYLNKCRSLLNYQEGLPDHHMAMASSAYQFAVDLNERERTYYTPPSRLKFLSPHIEKFSFWWHWSDIHYMKELLLLSSVDEHIKLVKCEPTSLEAHAVLANSYVMLSSLYVDPRKSEEYDDEKWHPPSDSYELLKEKFRSTAQKAIEEFKILNDYAPDDPWVHSQLAYSYHDLQMPEYEIREYETILKLCPDDKEILFKLGMLYFQQGKNAKGLQIYEELKKTHYGKAESLIKFYGAYLPNESF